VHPIGPPDDAERRHHYLWRFWKRMPAAGIFAIFDRSWYGRVLVERVEKLTPKKTWRSAYAEINAFEEALANDGTPVIKFFLHVSAREQLKRFRERERNPFKRWKIGADDWRNRRNRRKYLEAYEDMFDETDTKRCPWHLIPAESKRYARLEVLRRTVQVLGSRLPPADFEHETGEKPRK
jgi:polyphosphate kinase 2 (PPK2 family)